MNRSNPRKEKTTKINPKREKDTEKIALPPIKHVETESDIVEINLALNPVHCS